MGRRFIKDRLTKSHARAHEIWVSAHEGRYWKRMLSKARRRAWKQDRIEGRLKNKYESFCAYKGW